MDNYTGMRHGSTGDGSGQQSRGLGEQSMGYINRPVPTPVITSLEERLDHLVRGVERAISIRQKLENIVAQLADAQEAGGTQGANPPSISLSARFGDSIGHLHTNLDEIERLAWRIEAALFDEKRRAKPEQCSPGPGR